MSLLTNHNNRPEYMFVIQDRGEDYLEMGILVNKYRRCYDPIFWIFLLGWMCVFFHRFIVVRQLNLMCLHLTLAYAPVLLERKADKIRKTIGAKKAQHQHVRTVFESDDRHWKGIMSKALARPFAIFFREPIMQLLGAYMAFIYGLIYRMYSPKTHHHFEWLTYC